ncbi:MAG: hypothetical protein HPY70_13620 [Firmicutes bacterium]|nr:hypothetical protein [Bacillota bacterium]
MGMHIKSSVIQKLAEIFSRYSKVKKAALFTLLVVLFSILTACTISDKQIPASSDEDGILDKIPYSLMYLDCKGDLHLKSFREKKDKVIIEGEEVVDYELSPKGDYVAYISEKADKDVRDFTLFNFKTKETKILGSEMVACEVKWSSSGEYLLLDSGTSIYRDTKIYDVQNDSIIKFDHATLFAQEWSPSGDKLAVGFPEEVGENPLNVTELDGSVSAVVNHPMGIMCLRRFTTKIQSRRKSPFG